MNWLRFLVLAIALIPAADQKVRLRFVVPPVTPPSVTCTHYWDADVSAGSHTGTSANPFQTEAQMWSTVNTALASSDVTVCVSAREAGSDTNDVADGEVDLNNRSDTSSHRVTFNGRSFYNSNDTTPSWLDYSGSSRARACARRGPPRA